MTFVVTIEDVSPAPRADGVPWNRAKWQQAELAAGPWTDLETIALDPLDADPLEPQSRNLTTTQATLDPGWYRIVFLDAGDAEQASEPVHSAPVGTAYTSAQAVRDRLAPRDQQGAGGGTAAALSDHDLQEAILDAANEINARIAARYTLPIVPTPQLIESLNRDIAAYLATLTYRRGQPLPEADPVALRYARAQALLDGIAKGQVELVGQGDAAEIAAGGPEAAVVNLYSGELFSPEDFDLATGLPPGYQLGSTNGL